MPPTTKKTTTKKPTDHQAPQPPNDKYAVTTWGSAGGNAGLTDLEVPSGQLCLVKRPGIEGLLKAGVLRDLDTLTSLVNEKVIKKTAKGQPSAQPEVDLQLILANPEKLDAIMHTVDRTVCECVVKPPIMMTPNDSTRRKGGVVYADMVDLTDKMFIFQFVVGGSQDLERFRNQLEGAMGDLGPVQAVESAAQ